MSCNRHHLEQYPDKDEIELMVTLLYAHYDSYYFQTANSLVEFIKLEFDEEVTEEQVKDYIYNPILEETEVRIIYRNMGYE
jgi:hypothetical protein